MADYGAETRAVDVGDKHFEVALTQARLDDSVIIRPCGSRMAANASPATIACSPKTRCNASRTTHLWRLYRVIASDEATLMEFLSVFDADEDANTED